MASPARISFHTTNKTAKRIHLPFGKGPLGNGVAHTAARCCARGQARSPKQDHTAARQWRLTMTTRTRPMYSSTGRLAALTNATAEQSACLTTRDSTHSAVASTHQWCSCARDVASCSTLIACAFCKPTRLASRPSTGGSRSPVVLHQLCPWQHAMRALC